MSKHTPETHLSDLFEKFLRERKYELGVSTATISWYRQAWGLFVGKKTLSLPDLTEDRLKEFSYVQRDRGIKPISVYTRARALNSFMRWLHAHKHLDERIGYVPDKGGKRIIQTLKVDALKTLVTFRPKTWNHKRIHAMTVALLDTGCRISELLDSTVSDWDLDDLLLTVVGKGNKQRRIPFSPELRKSSTVGLRPKAMRLS
jgi:integrase/recombinase XerD